jgi:hypothetical protein
VCHCVSTMPDLTQYAHEWPLNTLVQATHHAYSLNYHACSVMMPQSIESDLLMPLSSGYSATSGLVLTHAPPSPQPTRMTISHISF